MTNAPKSATGINPIRERAVERLRRVVLDALGDHAAAVYLFGSHARGEVRHASDIDIAILPRDELPGSFFAELADTIEESTIPYDVDLVDLREVGPAFREEVLRTGIKWRD
jgi:predicted nucleotidyltransferase